MRATRKNADERLSEIEHLLRGGHPQVAAKELRALCRAALPRESLPTVCRQLIRTDMASSAIKILHPLVRPADSFAATGTAEEICEYAAAIARLGAVEEAESLLDSLPDPHLSRAVFTRIAILFKQWRYEESIPWIERYLELEKDPYRLSVGRVNQSAALIATGDLSAADALIREKYREAKSQGWKLLELNYLELRAQLHVVRQEWKDAAAALSEARSVVSSTDDLSLLFIHKWSAFYHAMNEASPSSSLSALRLLRAEAVARKHWETVRECARIHALVFREEKALWHLYFGTPYSEYRRKVLRDFGNPSPVPCHYQWTPREGEKAIRALDLSTGVVSGKPRAKLKPGQSVHRLVLLLARDFFRPHSIGSVFSQLFPGEIFHPVYSSARVHQVILRLRAFTARTGVRIEITNRHQLYRLRAAPGVAIVIPAVNGPSQGPWAVELLRRHYGARAFSAAEAQKALGVSRATILRWIDRGMKSGFFVKLGTGSAVSYRLKA